MPKQNVRKVEATQKNGSSMKQALLQRTQKSYNNRNYTGSFKLYLKSGLEIPMWECKEGRHKLDILPFKSGKFNPDPDVHAGDYTYLLDLWAHRGVGPNNDWVLCLAKNWNKPCPICEYQAKLRQNKNTDPKTIKDLYPKRRTLYNIWCHDSQMEHNKGVQVWEVAHFLMEKNLIEIAADEEEVGGGVVIFSDPEEGKVIKFKREGSGAEDTKYIGHRLDDRDYKIPEKILKSVFTLDELLDIPTYKSVSDLFFGSMKEEDTADAFEDIDDEDIDADDGDDVDDFFGDSDSDGDDAEDDDQDDDFSVELDDDEDDEPAPPKTRQRVQPRRR